MAIPMSMAIASQSHLLHFHLSPVSLRSLSGQSSPLNWTYSKFPFSLKHNRFNFGFKIVDSGGRIYAMRHGRRVPKPNRPPDQRKALLRGMTTQLLKHGRIKTTRARASVMRKFVDKMITRR